MDQGDGEGDVRPLDDVFKLPLPVSLEREGIEGSRVYHSQDVIVLAKNVSLSELQRDLLNKGLSFVPSLNIGRDQKSQWDIQQYHRKIKLAVYYRNSTKKEPHHFTGPSTWTPPLERLPPAVGELIKKDLKAFKNKFRFIQEDLNISVEESRALMELQKKKNIVIKPADKGSVVVVLDREQHIFEVERQLKDSEYYEKLDRPIYSETIPMVATILDNLTTI